MRFTSEDLAKSMGLNVGDRIKFSNGEIAIVDENYILDFYPWKSGLATLVNEDFEILPQKKRVGELLCKDLDCERCTFNSLNCAISGGDSNLYEHLEGWYEKFQDKEIYDILKARLDKEEE